MKKIISILIIALSFGIILPAQAQIKFGIKAGANLLDASVSTKSLKTDNFTGFHIGPMVDIAIPIIGLGVDGAFMYSQRGVKLDGETSKENGIEVPVNLKYTFGLGNTLGIFLAAGPSFFFNMSDKWDNSDSWKLNRKKAQVAINVGGGLKLFNHLQLGVNYNIPLSESKYEYEELVGGDATYTNKGTYKTKGWQVSVAYMF